MKKINRWLIVALVIGLAYQQVAIIGLRHDIYKRDSTIATLQATVDYQGDTIVGLKRGLRYQVRIAALMDNGGIKKK